MLRCRVGAIWGNVERWARAEDERQLRFGGSRSGIGGGGYLLNGRGRTPEADDIGHRRSDGGTGGVEHRRTRPVVRRKGSGRRRRVVAADFDQDRAAVGSI